MDIVNIIAWIVVGAIAGWLASIVMKTNASQGLLTDIIVGIIGGFLGGWVASLLGLGSITGFNLGSFAIALGGSCLLLWITGMFRRK